MPEYPQKRQYARYRLQKLDDAFVIFSGLGDGSEMERPLFNLSYKGVGFHPQKGDSEKIPLLKKISAKLRLLQEELEIWIEVIYVHKEIAGARITPKNSSDIQKIIRFISPMELGESLMPVKPNVVRQVQKDRKCTWYVGKNNTELVLWRNPSGKLVEFRLIFYLFAVFGNLLEGKLATADLNPHELGYIPIYEPWPEDVAHWHEEPNREALQLAIGLIEYADKLALPDKEEVSDWIVEGDKK